MKKYLNYSMVVVILMTLCIGFYSCSKDDNAGGGNNSKNKIDFYLDGTLIPWVDFCGQKTEYVEAGAYTSATYYISKFNDGTPMYDFEIYIYFDKVNAGHSFHVLISQKNINDIKVGDDLLYQNTIVNQPSTIINYSRDIPSMGSPDSFNWWYKDPGTMIVKAIDTKKQFISLEIKDLFVSHPAEPMFHVNYEEHTINANIQMYYTIENN